MGASGRRWTVAGLGLAAIAAGVGCWYGSWWVLFRPAASGPPPDGPPGLGMLAWAGRVQALQFGGLFLVGFGLISWLLALNHWLWEGGRAAGDVRRDEGPRPRFIDPD